MSDAAAANKAAGDAQTTANEAKQAASEADTKAGNAQKAAEEADAKAVNANANANTRLLQSDFEAFEIVNDAAIADAKKAGTDAQTTANNANTLANSKAKVFTTTPITPYKIGDIWTSGPSGELMKCKITRTTGSY